MPLKMENTITDHLEVTYEIFVQSFADSNGDGIGDIPGMTNKLGYLKELGIEAVWLMPISKSPSYHKYDVVDYKSIHADYGNMDDFKAFVKEAHDLGIKVIIDFIINHTSNKHPWFLESKKGKNNPYRDYYIWQKEKDVEEEIAKREISHDSDNITQWHKAGDNEELYYGFFSDQMPDLNYDNPKVFEEIVDIGRYWLEDIGVDGLRMDAAKHIFPDHRAEDNHKFWVKFRNEMEAIKPDVYIVGEVWDNADNTAPFSKGLSSLFNFDLASSILYSLKNEKLSAASIDGNAHRVEKGTSFLKILKKNSGIFKSQNSRFVDGIFLSNHDQNRAASELENDLNKIKQAAVILFTLPGRPFIYYGEELGMLGSKPDEFIREPFLWSANGDSSSMTKWIKSKYSKLKDVPPVDAQKQDSGSVLNLYKELIQLRKNSSALRSGELSEIELNDKRLLCFQRQLDIQSLLMIHNLSSEAIELDKGDLLSEYTEVEFELNIDSNSDSKINLGANGSIILKK